MKVTFRGEIYCTPNEIQERRNDIQEFAKLIDYD